MATKITGKMALQLIIKASEFIECTDTLNEIDVIAIDTFKSQLTIAVQALTNFFAYEDALHKGENDTINQTLAIIEADCNMLYDDLGFALATAFTNWLK